MFQTHRSKPLVAALHLPPSLSYAAFPGVRDALSLVRNDVAVLLDNGIDAILLENDNDKPHTLTIDKAQTAWLTRVASEIRNQTRAPVGINVQRIDWEATFAIAVAAELDFARLDVFVDQVKMLEEEVHMDPESVVAYRNRLGGKGIEIWADVHVKHSEILSKATIEESSVLAVESGAAAVLVSGNQTGEAPVNTDLSRAAAGLRAKNIVAPVIIASGLRPDNADTLCRLSDGAVVGTCLKDGDRISKERVQALVKEWDRALASQR